MTEMNNYLRIIENLEKEGVDFIIVGGIAVILYGMPRTSEDLDIIINMTNENIKKLRKALSKLFDDEDIKEITYNELKDYAVMRYISPNDDIIDLISNLGEAFNYSNLSYQKIEIENVNFKIATPQQLIKMKSNTYRDKDKMDIMFLKELLRK
jgi:methylmalonyl-CoA mutase cobalamin-binding subunit